MEEYLTIKELKQICRNNNISNFSKLKKQDLLKLINDNDITLNYSINNNFCKICNKEFKKEMNEENINLHYNTTTHKKNMIRYIGLKNANINGEKYENKTEIKESSTDFKHINSLEKNGIIIDYYNVNNLKFIKIKQNNFIKYMKSYFNEKCEKKTKPDECFIYENNLFLLEKKYQSCKGSVDEKIQTGPFKKYFYKEQYPDFNIHFAYVFNDWFKDDKYKPEMRFNEINNIKVFWSEDEDYEKKLKDWLIENN